MEENCFWYVYYNGYDKEKCKIYFITLKESNNDNFTHTVKLQVAVMVFVHAMILLTKSEQ